MIVADFREKTKSQLSRISMILPQQRLFLEKRGIKLEINLYIYLEYRTFATNFLLNCNFAA